MSCSSRVLYIFNPTDQRRTQLVRILVNTHEIHVTSNNQPIDACQIEPKWTGKKSNMMEKNLFELVLLVDIESYSLKEYTLHLSTTQKSCSLITLEYFNDKDKPLDSGPFKIEIIEKKIVKLSNHLLSVSFSKTGSLLNVQHLEHDEKVSFTSSAIFYGTSTQPDHNSGAYLFLPDGDAQELPMGTHDLVRIQRGSLVNRYEILHEMYGLQYSLTNTNGKYEFRTCVLKNL